MAKLEGKDVGSRLLPAGLRAEALETFRAPKLAGLPYLAGLPHLTGVRPGLLKGLPDLTRLGVGRMPRPFPPARVPEAPTGPEPDVPPPAPRTDPFAELPFRSPGDRILAEDFNQLSQALDQLAQSQRLSSALFGTRFGAARSQLESHGYVIRRAVSVFGNSLDDLHDASAADRLVVSVSLTQLGAPGVDIVLSGRVEGRRLVPDLRGRSYANAHGVIRNLLADVPVPPSPGPAPNLIGSNLAAQRNR